MATTEDQTTEDQTTKKEKSKERKAQIKKLDKLRKNSRNRLIWLISLLVLIVGLMVFLLFYYTNHPLLSFLKNNDSNSTYNSASTYNIEEKLQAFENMALSYNNNMRNIRNGISNAQNSIDVAKSLDGKVDKLISSNTINMYVQFNNMEPILYITIQVQFIYYPDSEADSNNFSISSRQLDLYALTLNKNTFKENVKKKYSEFNQATYSSIDSPFSNRNIISNLSDENIKSINEFILKYKDDLTSANDLLLEQLTNKKNEIISNRKNIYKDIQININKYIKSTSDDMEKYYKFELSKKDIEAQYLPLIHKIFVSIFLITLAGFFMNMIKNEVRNISLLDTLDYLKDTDDITKNDKLIDQSITVAKFHKSVSQEEILATDMNSTKFLKILKEVLRVK